VDGSGTDEDRKIKRVNSTGNDLGLYVLLYLRHLRNRAETDD
jgi:hypothetical protein